MEHTRRQAHTYVTLEVSVAAYDEIRTKLIDAGYIHVFRNQGEIDMHGLALTRKAPRRSDIKPAEQLNDFCMEPPCASDRCWAAQKCLHSS
jgi:hypothetical protein